ncbi:hypothetical protein [Egicoccus halophilus]|uniref:Uncharacterized protein n=1 Tax=Egicoccus halophilus TaxID=1670830 RepID=A0A8J3EU46_9ACTN|nr:hypothetical protein [Egicoccus halophilus]GGI06915.1 hypothetical protein GCM10011354_21480 [Egicoccus halophilus]
MVRITLDPDEVNQDREFTLVDGRTVLLDEADEHTLREVARQLYTHHSSYASAFAPADETRLDRLRAGEAPLDELAPLHRRVRQLLELQRSPGGRSPRQLDPSVLLQRRIWNSASGVSRPLEELTPTHRRNLLGWLERHSEALAERFAQASLSDAQRALVEPRIPWVLGTPLHQRLEELIAAETSTEQARDEARQVMRKVAFTRQGEWPER